MATSAQVPAGVTVVSWGKATGDWNFCTVSVSQLTPGVAGSTGIVAYSSGTVASYTPPS